MSKLDVSLYLVTDRDLVKNKTMEEAIEEAILGGTTLVQLREKDCSSLDFYKVAMSVKKITDKYNVPLIINDRIDIALSVDAAGVHLGQSDIPCKIAREILPKGKIIGVSAHNLEEALKAKEDGADYLGCGAIFATLTKNDVTSLAINELADIKKNIGLPMVAIGGINSNNIEKLYGTGIDGVAVVSAIIGKDDIKAAAEDLKRKIKNLVNTLGRDS